MSVKEVKRGGPATPPGGGRKPPLFSTEWFLAIPSRVNRALYRQAPEVWDNMRPTTLFHNIYKSIYRTTAFPKTERERSEAFFNSFLLHIQPAKIEKQAETLARECAAKAAEVGIPLEDIQEEVGDIQELIASRLEEAAEADQGNANPGKPAE